MTLTRFIRWVLHEQIRLHQVLPRYRRIWFPDREGYGRRSLIWTTQHSEEKEARHEVMRQRQEAWRHEKEEKQRQAEQLRKEEAERQREAQRQEEERQRKIRAEAERLRWEEQKRQWAIEAEQDRQRREAKERQRQEQAAAAEQERQRQEQIELKAAQQWWSEVSTNQLQQLRDAVSTPLWNKKGARVEFATQATADTAYGFPAYLRSQLYGILRPSPASLRRLPPAVPVFVRHDREAQLLTSTGQIDPARVVHFDLPDHEQMSLI